MTTRFGEIALAKNKTISRNAYRPVKAVYLSSGRCGARMMTLLNRYAKSLGIPVRDVVPAILLDVLPDRIASGGPLVKRKV
jgi:hypothetical protein